MIPHIKYIYQKRNTKRDKDRKDRNKDKRDKEGERDKIEKTLRTREEEERVVFQSKRFPRHLC